MKKIYTALLLLPLLASGQTQQQNHILSTVYKDSVPNPATVKTVVYFDGLGRPIQQRIVGQSGSGKDIVTHTEYDSQGRQPKEYLPFRSSFSSLEYSGSALTDLQQYYASSSETQTGNPNFEITQYPYSEKQFEASPLDRVLRQSAPGEAWKLDPQGGDDRSIKIESRLNVATDMVRVFTATAGTVTNLQGYYDATFTKPIARYGVYLPGELYKTIMKNENWEPGQANPLANTTEEFKDKLGRMILKRTYGESLVNGTPAFASHDTYYVYDQYGNLSFVIPPMADSPATQLDQLCYQYRYDGRNRMVEKKLPGKPWEFIVYDKMNRISATGPVSSPFGDGALGWIVTKYDGIGRTAYTAWYDGMAALTSGDRKAMQDAVNASMLKVESRRTAAPSTIDGVSVAYSNDVFPNASLKLLTANYYDDYTFPNAHPHPGMVLGKKAMATYKGMPTGSWVRTVTLPSESAGITVSIFYDHKGRVLRSHSGNHLGGHDISDSSLDFSGKAIYSLATHKKDANAGSQPLTIREDFTYSAQDRLLTHTHQINGGDIHLMASNAYDELGQLVRKEVGGLFSAAQPLQVVDYKYNVRGWLKEINDTENLQKIGDPGDLFAFKLSYDTTNDNVPGIRGLYNGNISQTYWRTAGDDVLRKYSYRYDDMNRLREAFYQRNGQLRQSYNENMDYDKNGNILHLNRNGALDAQNAVIEIDRLDYSYEDAASPNRLTKVFDRSAHPLGFKDDSDGIADSDNDYSYDGFGNLTEDQNKKISRITYNHLNLPLEIVFDSGKINYLYDANGTKLRKTVTAGTAVTVTDYANGYQYANDVLQFFPTAEGYVKNTVGSGGNSYDYAYIYKDHLGNNRLTYGVDRATGVMKIMEENHYYPFGLKHGSYNTGLNDFQRQESAVVLKAPVNPNPGDGDVLANSFKYRYNGKEFQEELGLNMYDYGARNYDPAIGRWMNIDPLAETSRRWTPYNYCYNNPVFFIDPDGMESGAPDGFVDAGYGRMVSVRTMSMSMEYSAVLSSEEPEMPIGTKTDPPKKNGKISSMTIEKIDMKDRMVTGYPGQALDELLTAGIQWIGTEISGSNVSKETSENAQFMTTLAIVIFSKGKNGKADAELVEQIAEKGSKSLVEQGADLVKQNGGKNSITLSTPNQQIRYDLAGKAHNGVPTPHKQVYLKNVVNGQVKSITRESKKATSLTQQELRMIRNYLKKINQ